MVRCGDGSLYTGITTDVERRIGEHNSDKLGARYTRSRQPVELVYQEELDTRSEASQREGALKKLSRVAKRALVERLDNIAK